MMADLLVPERQRLKALVGLQRSGRLMPDQERELRQLIGREFPKEAATLKVADLGLLGLGMMGAWYLFDERPSRA